MLEKKIIRKQLLQIRRQLDDDKLSRMSTDIFNNFIKWFRETNKNMNYSFAATYKSFDKEADTMSINQYLLSSGIRLFVPIVTKEQSLDFGEIDSDTRYKINKYGIEEPSHHIPLSTTQKLKKGFFIIPFVGCNNKGYRLGFGKGYYDRYFKQNSNLRDSIFVGLGYEFQCDAEFKETSFDINFDIVITEKSTHLYNNL